MQISCWVGAGRISPQGQGELMFAQRGGEGILWPIVVDGTQHWLWCNERQWCEWASPVVSIKGLQELSTDMLSIASELVGYEITEFNGKNIVWQMPVKACAVVAFGPVLRFSKDERWLECRLLEWPNDALQYLTSDWLPTAIGNDESRTLRCTAALQIGTLSATIAQIKQWQVGDGVLISNTAELSRSQLWVCISNRHFLMMLQPSGEFLMLKIVEESEKTSISNQQLMHINDVEFTVSVEIGSISLSLVELLNLKPGDCISGQLNIDREVSLVMQGKKIGRGNLLNINGQWFVRILAIN